MKNISISLVIVSIFHPSWAFLPSLSSQGRMRPPTGLLDGSTPSTNSLEELLYDQRNKAKDTVGRIESLKSELLASNSSSAVLDFKDSVQAIEQDVARLTAQVLPPKGLSMEQFKDTMKLILRLPFTARLALCEALEYENPQQAASDLQRVPDIAAKLYEQRVRLTPARLQSSLEKAKTKRTKKQDVVSVLGEVDESWDILPAVFGDEEMEELTRNGVVENFLGRVTRKKDVSEADLQVLLKVLDSKTFVVSSKDAISGGYLIRGTPKKTPQELIDTIDAKLPQNWDAQVCLLPDILDNDDFGFKFTADLEPVLVVIGKDLAPTTSPWLTSFCSAAALITAVLFSVGVYGGNELVTQRLTDMSSMGDFSGLDWFNLKAAEVLLPVLLCQLAHECGHWIVAAKDNIKTAPPTLIPFWQLPFMGAQTQLKSSPKNLTSLFDFAFIGPFLGMLTSFVFLLVGLQATVEADASVAQYFPALPVSVLRLSTLGSSLIENVLGGDIVLRDPTTAIPLHPFAVAGFSSLVVQAVDLMPLGASDGARLSVSIFGRVVQSVVGGVVWFLLLGTTLFVDSNDVLIGSWIVYNLIQNDMEVPCRNELESVDLVRGLFAGMLWFAAILTLTPVTVTPLQ